MYTAAPASTADVELSTSLSFTVRGTPAAVVVDDPKLDRMSRRTTPLSVRTFGPFEPSPGYGPAVSWGILPGDVGEPVAAAVVLVVAVDPPALVVELPPAAVLVDEDVDVVCA